MSVLNNSTAEKCFFVTTGLFLKRNDKLLYFCYNCLFRLTNGATFLGLTTLNSTTRRREQPRHRFSSNVTTHPISSGLKAHAKNNPFCCLVVYDLNNKILYPRIVCLFLFLLTGLSSKQRPVLLSGIFLFVPRLPISTRLLINYFECILTT